MLIKLKSPEQAGQEEIWEVSDDWIAPQELNPPSETSP
ncbi:hypothetical protein DNAOFDDG_00330 [Mannheimia haemolytica]|nr:hypothetical protein AU484_gp50 [Mannheimia phage vB_MhS_587AP2]AJA73025.1 hypothetical protein 587AP2_50 [Mannheimia phage vB_MhS_587AP2]